MTDPLSLTYRNGRRFTRRRARQMAFLKALDGTGSAVHAAAVVDFDRFAFCSGAHVTGQFILGRLHHEYCRI